MADDGSVLLRGKPLESYKVIDLKDELKRRGLAQSGAKAVLCTRLREVLTREEVEEKANTVDNTDHQVVEKETLHVDDHVKKADELEVTQHSENAHDQGLIGNGTEEKMVEGDEIAITAPLEKREAESEQVDKHQTEEMEESGKDGPGGPRSPGGDVSESPIATVIVQPGARKRRLVIHKSLQREGEGESSVDMPRKKRAWGMSKPSEPHQSSVAISTDSLKELIPDEVSSAIEKEAVAEESDTSNEGEDSDSRQAREGASARRSLSQGDIDMVEKQPRQKLISLRQQRLSAPGAARIAVRGITEAIASTQDANRTRRTPSPARNPVSCILHVTNLVRPFSLPQIKEFLSQKGHLVDNGFWIDRIKSHCYAVYSSEEEARAMRDVIHGLKWPSTSPKFLSVDFATKEEADRAMGIAEPPPTVTQPAVPKTEEEIGQESKPSTSDDGKQVVPHKPDTISHVTEDETDASKPDNAAAAKLLDDLFRKTKSQPAIYWIPLTDEQVLLRNKKRKEEEARLERLREERKREREREREKEREKEREGDGGEQRGSRNREHIRETERERRDQDRPSRNLDRERRRSRSRSIDRGRRR